MRRVLSSIAFLGWAVAVQTSPASATSCLNPTCGYDPTCNTQAVPAPPVLWAALEPLDLGPLPASRDQSDWPQNSSFHNGEHPLWLDVAGGGGWVFAAHNTGLQIWSHTGAADFPLISNVHLGDVEGVQFCHTPELKYPVGWVAVPEEDTNVTVLGGLQCDLGLLVFDSSSKAAPAFRYQAAGVDLRGAWATVALEGAEQVAVAGFADGGVHTYDLAAARALATPCVEETPGENGCGVYLGRLGTMEQVRGVHGSGTVVAAAGERIEVFDLEQPGAPLVSFDPGGVGLNYGVGVFRVGPATYLAGLHSQLGAETVLGFLTVWNVTSCLAGGCVGAPPIAAPGLPLFAGAGISNARLSTSVRANRPQLYVGTETACPGAAQSEWLFEVRPESTTIAVEEVGVGADYWRWYYPTNADGTFGVRPRRAAFVGDTLYRAAWTMLDAHRAVASAIFDDGFESGSAGQWSATVP